MMKAALLATALLVLPAFASAQEAEEPKSQNQLNVKHCHDADEAQATLDLTYQAVVKEYSYDPRFLKYLETAQKAWVAFRDSEINAVFPPEYRHAYGSMEKTCECDLRKKIIYARIMELEQWRRGVDISQGCNGTMKEYKTQ
ncbi:MAG TPA: lysozyme inhibitor LprI family protein [Rickettsiales bacterium]|nr:lysozyme inhibitor LprI family protein [Rickettsiales bacterium]